MSKDAAVALLAAATLPEPYGMESLFVTQGGLGFSRVYEFCVTGTKIAETERPLTPTPADPTMIKIRGRAIFTYMYAYIYKNRYIYVYIYIYLYTSMPILMCTYIYIYIYEFI